MKKAFFLVFIVCTVFSPTLAFAVDPINLGGGGTPTVKINVPSIPNIQDAKNESIGQGGLVPAPTGGQYVGNYSLCDLKTLADNLIKFAVSVSVFVATLMFAYGGILYVTSAAGGEAQIKKAHSALLKSFIGILIILLAWLIVNIVISVISGQGIANWTRIACTTKYQTTSAFNNPPPSNNNNNNNTQKNAVNAPPGSCILASQTAAVQYGSTSNCNPSQFVPSDSSIQSTVNKIQNNSTLYGAMQQCSQQSTQFTNNKSPVPLGVYMAISGIECDGKNNCCDPVNGCAATCVGGYGATGVSCGLAQSYCKGPGSSQSYCNGIVGGSNDFIVNQLQTNPTLAVCSTGYGMNSLDNKYGDWANAGAAYNSKDPDLALGPSQSCPGYRVIQCPNAGSGSQWPYCGVTCAYHDKMDSFISAAGGVGYEYFKEYMAAAEASLASP
ncbi:hypothetical protein HY090_03180 [Candidatus Kaiserbacteria bacterium]|nr:hypothetical protein [Candidatus Kaiserbacteria bacterium]